MGEVARDQVGHEDEVPGFPITSGTIARQKVSIAAALNLNAKRIPKAHTTIRRPPDDAAPTPQKGPIMPPQHTLVNMVGK